MLKSQTAVVLLIVASLLSMCLAGCGPQASTPASTGTSELVFLSRNMPPSLDPAIVTGWSVRIMDPVYEALLTYQSGTGELVGRLAESWTLSPDGKEYSFKLRKGVKFHDGASFNAEAVKVNFERVQAVGTGPATVLGPVKAVEVVNEYEVKVIMDKPYAAFPQAVTQLGIVSPKAISDNKKGDDWAREWLRDNMAGTGPYKLEKWDSAEEVVLARVSGYWGGWPQKNPVDRIVYRKVLEVATQKMMLERKEADIIDQVTIDDVAVMKQNPDYHVEVISDIGMFYIMMRSDRGPLQDKRVRQALTHAFPWEKYEQATVNFYPMGRGPIPAGLEAHDNTITHYKQDLTRARELLREAGVDPSSLKLQVAIVEKWGPMVVAMEMFQLALKELGIELKIQELNWTAHVAQARNPNTAADMAMVSVGAKMPDPILLLMDSFHSKSSSTAYNWAWYSSPQLDALLESAQIETDPAKQKDIYRQVQQTLVQDAPAIFLMESTASFVLGSWVKGYKPNPHSAYLINFKDLTVEK